MNAHFLKNAVANVSRGGAGALIAVILPPVLIRHMSSEQYATWVLVLQVAAYVGYLDLGLQTAVGRYVAFANARKDTGYRDCMYSTAFAGLTLAAILGSLLLIAGSFCLRFFFPAMPASSFGVMRLALLIVGVSVALGLPASAWNGVFVGMQRYELPALTVGLGKLLFATGLIAAVLSGKSLIFMACVVAGVNLLTYAFQYWLVRRLVPDIAFRRELISGPEVRELSGYCASLTVWSFSMLLVNGLDIMLVGHFEFGAVAPYAVCATLVTFVAGMQNAIVGVIMPHSAALHARNDSRALGELLVRSTKLGVLILLFTGLPLIVFAAPLIRVWIGSFSEFGGKILVILVLANVVRLIGAPYASILIGTGQQRNVVITPLSEGITNLIASVLLGWKFGAIGIAWGTLIGAMVGIVAHVGYNIPRTKFTISVSPLSFLRGGLAVPLGCAAPVLVAKFLAYSGVPWANAMLKATLNVSLLACATVMWRVATQSNRERTKV